MMDAADRIALQDLACRYAQAVDRRDYEALGALFVEDAELHVPHMDLHYRGRQEIVDGIRNIEMFESTYHAVHNQLAEIKGEQATGETYCVALHFSTDEAGRKLRYDMGIRYLDVWRNEGGSWQFVRRELTLDWEHTQVLSE